MEPISFSFEPTRAGEHMHVKVRSGVAGSRGLCGTITMRDYEWNALRAVLEGAHLPDTEEYVPTWASKDNIIRYCPVDDRPIVVQPESDPEAVSHAT